MEGGRDEGEGGPDGEEGAAEGRGRPRRQGPRSPAWFCRHSNRREGSLPVRDRGAAGARDALVGRGLRLAFDRFGAGEALPLVPAPRPRLRPRRARTSPWPRRWPAWTTAAVACMSSSPAASSPRRRNCSPTSTRWTRSAGCEHHVALADAARKALPAAPREFAGAPAHPPPRRDRVPRTWGDEWRRLAAEVARLWDPAYNTRERSWSRLTRTSGTCCGRWASARSVRAEVREPKGKRAPGNLRRYGGPVTVHLEVAALGMEGGVPGSG